MSAPMLIGKRLHLPFGKQSRNANHRNPRKIAGALEVPLY
jgi:hypothetical protein